VIAFELIEPDPLLRIVRVLKLGFAMLLSAWTGKEIDPEDFEPRPPEARRDDAPEPCLSPRQSRQLLGSLVTEYPSDDG